MNKPTKIVLAIAFCTTSLLAQRVVHPSDRNEFPFAGTDSAPPTLQKIYSNLGTGTDVYVGSGFLLTGPNSAAKAVQYLSIPFTPNSNSTVEVLSAAIQYSSGANQINLSLYSDSAGTPGTLLAGPFIVKNVPTYYTCCKLATAVVKPSLSVTGGTQYWLIADTPPAGTGSDFQGAWSFVPPLKSTNAFNLGNGEGWFPQADSIEEPAGAIYGTVP